MTKQRFVYYQEDEMWIGYWEQFPDYRTQGESLEDLKSHLRELWDDLTSGETYAVSR